MGSTTQRVRRVIVSGLAAAGVAIAVVGPAAAGAPQPVSIVAHMTKQGVGTFEASGPAVDTGLVCRDGAVLDTDNLLGGFQSGQRVQVQSRKELTCRDGSGTILVKIQIHVVFGGDEPFLWVIQGGTGAYDGLVGSGQGITADNSDVSNANIYDGFVVRR